MTTSTLQFWKQERARQEALARREKFFERVMLAINIASFALFCYGCVLLSTSGHG